MQTFKDPILENALISLIRLAKAASYYPDAHPSVSQAVTVCAEKFKLGLRANQDEFISVEIKRQGFIRQDAWLNPENKILPQLAQRFFNHKIKALVIFPHLREQHLLALVHCLALEPQQLEDQGGAARVLEQKQANGILLNEIDLGAIGKHKRNLDANPPVQHKTTNVEQEQEGYTQDSQRSSDSTLSQTLALTLRKAQQLLARGEPKQLPEFQLCLDKLMRQLDTAMNNVQQHSDVMQALSLLDRCLNTPSCPHEYAKVCRTCLQNLDYRRTTMLLLDNASRNDKQQKMAERLIKLLDSDCSNIVWQQLISEPDLKVRRFLTKLMEALGPDADSVMLEYLNDSRWYIVRNAVKILSSRRNPEYIEPFSFQLRHTDDRVVKEALLALAGIRHEKAVDALLSYLNSATCTHPDLAILALGAQKNTRAVKSLCHLALRRDPLLKNKKTTLKVIEAIGDIQDPAANNALLSIIKKRKLIKYKGYNELRLAAINALGKTATQTEQEVLLALSSSRNTAIAKGARYALHAGKKG